MTFIQTASLIFWKKKVPGKKMLLTGVMLLILLTTYAILFSKIFPNYDKTCLEKALNHPCKEFPFGTDGLGRCMLARTTQGVKISMTVALSATVIDLIIGLLWATLSLAGGKRVDFFLMRLTEILHSIPKTLVVILFLLIFNRGFFPVILAMAATGWIPMARIIRNQFFLLNNQGYVLASKAMNASVFHILFHHLLPNTISPILSTMIFTIPSAIYTEAFISFLGLGIQPPRASLGTLVKDGLNAIDYYPWLFFIPATFLIALSIIFNLIGEGTKLMLQKEEYFE
ncbi:ABC transporter permease [Chlamydiifrater phoenicopteri]|uniref:ABC transporter permease n=1 Tax=Chlamydiifrater phoenicopteri TaxID=2681469 RepID=UPI001FEC3510|nr:ABC transporter permease [Chlamydiifrater phoenicopteri]